MTKKIPDQPTDASKDAIFLNQTATEVYALLRSKTTSPGQGTLICMMVMYFMWSESKMDTFELWHNWVQAQLAQMHLDNNPNDRPIQ